MSTRILWIDKRDGEGILIHNGNKYYFESSSSPLFDFGAIESVGITFETQSQQPEPMKSAHYGALVAFNVKAKHQRSISWSNL